MPIIKEDPLGKYDPAKFTFTKMKDEVTEAMRADWKYNQVDNAKKRAIYDAKTYDDFKQRVAGCTLKPIHKNEFNEPPKFAFNRQMGGGPAAGRPPGIPGVMAPSATAPGPAKLPTSRAQRGVPKTGREFERELRRCSGDEEKVALLQLLDGNDCGRLFGRELDAEVLRQLLVALDATLGTPAAPLGTARQFLSPLAANCPASAARAASFLDASERELVARVLARDPGMCAPGTGEDVPICAALGVQPSLVAAAAEREAEAGARADAPRVATTAGTANQADLGEAAMSGASCQVQPAEEEALAQRCDDEAEEVGLCDGMD